MRALSTVSLQFEKCIEFVHQKRRQALSRAVQGVVRSGHLSSSQMGRGMAVRTSEKHGIKAADRLLGNRWIQSNLVLLYRQLARWTLGEMKRPVVAVDATGLSAAFWEIRAALCFDGRALPLYSKVIVARTDADPWVQNEFLDELARVLPAGAVPILVTDAGYYPDWFDEVAKRGWDFVGRLRNQTALQLDGEWLSLKRLHDRATAQVQDLGVLPVRKGRSRHYRVVLGKKPGPHRRKRLTRAGLPGNRTDDRRHGQAAAEPWVLATSLETDAHRIYGLRMQIEEAFRCTKSHQFGWSLVTLRSKSLPRVAVLLLVASVATLLVHLVGVAAEASGAHRAFQANTVKSRRVLSLFLLGCRVLKRNISVSRMCLRLALVHVRAVIRAHAPSPLA